MRFAVAILLILLAFSFKNQSVPKPNEADFPNNYFASPVGNAIKLNGNFGELRPDHFHAGIDIDSRDGKVGEPVFAAADGFITRIKVTGGGYGNALYVKHPNGYTTVYGHLDRFSPEIARWVKLKQYEKESFSVDLDPKDSQFPVKKGEEIAKLGNAGSSSGPHLHFEIREAKTDHALNPLLFNLGVADDSPPVLRELKAYFLNDKKEETGKKAVPILKEKGVWKAKGDTVRFGAWRVAFGLKASDFQPGSSSNLGIYRIRLAVDGEEQYEYRMDEIDFDESRYVNAHMDYSAKKAFNAYFHRLWVLPGNKLPAYRTSGESGVVNLYKEKPRKITITASDAFGNESQLTFWAARDENMAEPELPPFNFAFQWDSDNNLKNENLRLDLPRGSLYQNLYLNHNWAQEPGGKFLSAVHHVQDNRTPVHRSFPIAIKPEGQIPAGLRSKAFIGYMEKPGGKPRNAGGHWEGDWLETKMRALGSFAILVDTEPPTISPVLFKKDMTKADKMAFRIDDNYGTTGTADGLDWRATVDGQWILMDFDSKKDRLIHYFDEKIGPGEHILKIVVKDDRGNERVFEEVFVR